MATREKCIAAAVRAGATEAEAVDMADATLASARNAESVEELAQMVKRTFDAEKRKAALDRKTAALTLLKRSSLEDSRERAQAAGVNFADWMTGKMVGSHRDFDGSRASAAGRYAGIMNRVRAELDAGLARIDGAGRLLEEDPAFGVAVHREMLAPGTTGDAVARAAAQVFSDSLERMRVRLNRAGANIGKLENYAPQSHDGAKLLSVTENQWVEFVAERLDWERSFPDMPRDAAARGKVLSDLYLNIATGKGQKATARQKGRTFYRPRTAAKSLEHERVLHFRDADAALSYHERFGSGHVGNAVFSGLMRSAKKLALMETFGPNPEAMITGMIDAHTLRVRQATPDEVAGLVGGTTRAKLHELAGAAASRRAAGDAAGADVAAAQWEQAVNAAREKEVRRLSRLFTQERQGRLANYYKELNGETGTPHMPTLASISQNIRFLQSMAKLGAATLSSISDLYTRIRAMTFTGENLLTAVHEAFALRLKRWQPRERAEIAQSLGVYAEGFMRELNSRFTLMDSKPGLAARWTDRFFRWSGLDAWTEGHKAAHTFYLAYRLAANLEKDFSQVNRHYAVAFRRHNLEKRWSLLRHTVADAADGRRYALPEKAYDVSDAALLPYLGDRWQEAARPTDSHQARVWEAARSEALDAERDRLATDLAAYYVDEVRYAVLEPDEKTRALMRQGTQAGTVTGEVLRFIGQFKSYPVVQGQRILREGRWMRAGAADGRAGAGQAALSAVPQAVRFAVASVFWGYVAMSAKDIFKQREPRDIKKPGTWIAAALQSGGLGILGDFFLGTADRFGNQALASVAGPFLPSATQVGAITGQLVQGDIVGARDTAIHLGVQNMPFVNLWYARPLLDWLALYHAREWMSPGTLARTERKIRKEYNQTYLRIGGVDLTPSKHVKRGGGFR